MESFVITHCHCEPLGTSKARQSFDFAQDRFYHDRLPRLDYKSQINGSQWQHSEWLPTANFNYNKRSVL